MLFNELKRIHSHLVFLGTGSVDLGAIALFWYCFRERDPCSTCSSWSPACACTPATPRSAASPRTSRPASTTSAARIADDAEARRRVRGASRGHPICLDRTKGIGLVAADDAIALGQSGPVLRASGVDWDLRKRSPTSPTTRSASTSRLPNGDVYDRYWCASTRCASRRASSSSALDGLPEGPWIADDRKVVLPPRHELHTSMESLIHHFKLVTEGFRVPAGEVYVAVESPRGELGCYLVSDGGPKPWRVHFRAASFVALEARRPARAR